MALIILFAGGYAISMEVVKVNATAGGRSERERAYGICRCISSEWYELPMAGAD